MVTVLLCGLLWTVLKQPCHLLLIFSFHPLHVCFETLYVSKITTYVPFLMFDFIFNCSCTSSEKQSLTLKNHTLLVLWGDSNELSVYSVCFTSLENTEFLNLQVFFICVTPGRLKRIMETIVFLLNFVFLFLRLRKIVYRIIVVQKKKTKEVVPKHKNPRNIF